MQFNNPETTLIKQRLNSPKLLLYLVAGLTLALDLFYLVLMAVAGQFTVNFGIFCLLCFLELIPFPVIFNSNFRFRYSRAIPTVCIVLNTLAMLLGVICGTGSLTHLALALFVLVHVLASFALVVVMLDASKRGKSFRIFAVASVALLIAAIACYAGFGLANGFFGQGGSDTRALEYTYDAKSDSYTVSAVLQGRSEKAVVPESFNGKPVTAVDCAVFENADFTELHLTKASALRFVGSFPTEEDAVDVFVDKSEINTLRAEILGGARTDKTLVALSNRLLPSGLEEDEVFISFNYSADALAYINYTPINTWFGAKGDVFSLKDHATGAFYATAFDPDDEAFLKLSYENGQKALIPPEHEGKRVDGTAISDSIEHLIIDFEDVFSITIAPDNDDYYETPSEIKSYGEDGVRYVLASDRGNLFGEIPRREGFELGFFYQRDGELHAIDSLSAYLGEFGTSVKRHTVYPQWTLKAPTVTDMDTSDADNTIVYGEGVTLIGDAVPPVDGMTLEYVWFDAEGNQLTSFSTKTHAMTNMLPTQTGVYRLRVTAYSASLTSLTSVAYGEVALTVGKRPINLSWTLPDNTVYSGTDKALSCVFDTDDLHTGDAAPSAGDYELNYTSVRNAGSYTLTATLLGNFAELYYIPASDNNHRLSITPYALSVNWESNVWTYNGTAIGPTADALGVGDEVLTPIELIVSGYGTNAGSHTARAAVRNNANYTVENSTKAYSIAKREITVQWQDTRSFIYNAQAHRVAVSAFGNLANAADSTALLGKLAYTGAAKDAGSHTMSITLNDQNYVLATSAMTSCDYVIDKKEVTLTWPSQTTFTYNGTAQRLEASVSGMVGSDTVTLTYSADSSNKNVGSYTSTVTGLSNSNYALPANFEAAYSIAQKTLNVSWSNETLTYNGQAQRHTATLSGMVSGESVDFTYSNYDANVAAGSHSISVSITDANYKLANASHSYSIAQRALTLNWSADSFIYNGEAQAPTATFGNVVSTDILTPIYTATASNVNVGSYEVTVSINNGNYRLPTNTKKAYTITPREITVTWATEREFTYDGTAKTVLASISSGLIPGDTVNLIYASAGTQTNAGSYTATITGLSNSNYELKNNKTCSFVITPREITVTWPGSTDLVYNGKGQRLEATVTAGVISGDTVTLSYSLASTNVNAGSYTSTITGVSNNNYVLKTNASCAYKITPVTLTLNWSNAALTYTGNAQRPTATVSGTVNGESVTLIYSNTASNVNVGSYEVTVSIENGNYELPANVTCTYTIAPVKLTLNWSNAALTYTGNAQRPTATVSGTVNGESVTLIYSNTASNVNVGSYEVTVSIDNSNYELPTDVTCAYTIIPAKLTLVFPTGSELTEDGTQKTFEASVLGELTPGAAEVTYTYKTADGTVLGSAPTEAGNYVVLANVQNENYVIDGKSEASFRILAAESGEEV